MTPAIHKLVNFINNRNKISPWCKHASFPDFRKYLSEELDELYVELLAEDKDQARVNEELGDVLILTLSLIAKYGSLRQAFEYAYKKMVLRAPYVLQGRMVDLEEELKLWDEGKKSK